MHVQGHLNVACRGRDGLAVEAAFRLAPVPHVLVCSSDLGLLDKRQTPGFRPRALLQAGRPGLLWLDPREERRVSVRTSVMGAGPMKSGVNPL